MVGPAIDRLAVVGGGGGDLGIGRRPEAHHGVGRRPPARIEGAHQALAVGRGGEEAGEGVEQDEAQRHRGRQQRAGPPAVAAEQHHPGQRQHDRQRAGPGRRGQQDGGDRHQDGHECRNRQISTDTGHRQKDASRTSKVHARSGGGCHPIRFADAAPHGRAA